MLSSDPAMRLDSEAFQHFIEVRLSSLNSFNFEASTESKILQEFRPLLDLNWSGTCYQENN